MATKPTQYPTSRQRLDEDYNNMHEGTRGGSYQGEDITNTQAQGSQGKSEQVGNALSIGDSASQAGGEQVNNQATPPVAGSNVDMVNKYYQQQQKNNGKKDTAGKWITALGDAFSSWVSMKGPIPTYTAEGSPSEKMAKRYQDIYEQQQKNKDSYLTAYLNAKKADDENAQNYFLNTLKLRQQQYQEDKEDATEKYNERKLDLQEKWYQGKLTDMEYKQELAKARLELDRLKEQHKMLKDQIDSAIAQQNADSNSKNAESRSKDAETNRQKVEQNGGGSNGISDAYGNGGEKEKLEF